MFVSCGLNYGIANYVYMMCAQNLNSNKDVYLHEALFAQFSLSTTVMYNASLAVYYVMVIVKGYKNKEVEKILVFQCYSYIFERFS